MFVDFEGRPGTLSSSASVLESFGARLLKDIKDNQLENISCLIDNAEYSDILQGQCSWLVS